MEKKWTLPNVLSMLRIVLVGVFLWAFFGLDKVNHNHILSGCVALTAAATDVLDGAIARHYHLISTLGQVLDPLADKLLQASVCVCIGYEYDLLIIPLIYLGKEFCMLLGGFLLLKAGKVVPPSRWFGKLGTVCFFVCTLAILFFCDPVKDRLIAELLLAFAALVMLGAFSGYFKMYFNLNPRRPKNGGGEA